MVDKEKNNSSISINNDDQQQQNDNLEENQKKLVVDIDENNSINSKKLTSQELTTTKENEDDPFHWPKKKKWIILTVLSCGAIIAPISSTIFYPAFLAVQEQLHTNDILVTTSAAVFLIFQGLGPLGWATYSDLKHTRRNVYLASLVLFIIASVICAVSNNIWLLIVVRCLQACGSNALHAIGPSTISDMFVPEERGNAFGIFYLFPLIGPLLGPAFGGYITQYLGWRWIFWLIAILAFIILIFIFLFVPETYRKQKNLPPPSSDSSPPTKRKFINPLASLILFRYPNLSIILSYISLFLSLIYIQAALIPREFNRIYHLSSSHTGLLFLSSAAGYMLGSVLGGRYSDYIIRDAKRTALIALQKKTENQKENDNMEGVVVIKDEIIEISKEDDIINLSLIKIEPERRIHGTWLGAIIIPICYLAYGWLLEYKVPIVFPIIVMFFGGFGQLLAFNPLYTYLIDSFPTKSVWVNANLTFLRQMIAGIMSILAVPMEDSLGTGWTFSVMVFLYTIISLSAIAVLFKGKQWRLKFEKDFNIEDNNIYI